MGPNLGPIIGAQSLATGQYVGSAGWLDSEGKVATKPRQYCSGDGIFSLDSNTRIADILDGTSQTLLVGERSKNVADATWVGVLGVSFPLCTKETWPVNSCVSSMFLVLGRTDPGRDVMLGDIPNANTPNDPGEGADSFSSRHGGVCDFLRCDGSVSIIKSTISPTIFRALGSRSGNEPIPGTEL